MVDSISAVSAGRVCRTCPRVATKADRCDHCEPEREYSTRRVRKSTQYNAAFRRKANRVKAAARVRWKTSLCSICGLRLFDDTGKLIGRELHAHHVYRGTNEHIEAAHSACNESAGEPPTVGEALAEVLGSSVTVEGLERP